jgi:hypothetical protein
MRFSNFLPSIVTGLSAGSNSTNKGNRNFTSAAQGEYKWAVGTLKEALDLLPSGDQKTATNKAVQDILAAGSTDWPTAEIQRCLEDYRPDRIKASIDGLEAHIEELSFDLAKQDWLRRMTADSDIQKALDDLHTHYLKNNERIEETAFPLFRKALEAVPIWITTAQSPQSSHATGSFRHPRH